MRLCILTGRHLTEIDSLLKPPSSDLDVTTQETAPLPLDSLHFVKAYSPAVDKARDNIIQEMESMVVNGLADLVRL